MKRLTMIATLFMLFVLMVGTASAAGQTSNGTLTVSATVNGSINLVFVSDGSGPTLTGSGTNAATLAFGNVSAYGTYATGVTRTAITGTNFTVSAPFDVQVSKFNSPSANYTLTAKLNTADATNTWAVGGTTVTSASAATVTSTGSYGANSQFALALTVPFATASGTNISNSLAFTATAN